MLTLLTSIFFAQPSASTDNEYGLPSINPEKVGMSPDRLDRIRPAMQRFVDEEKVPGLITAIVRDGKIVHLETYGQMDREANKPMRPDTLFRMYSMTKLITGVAVMVLYEEGHFALTDPISDYLPEFKQMNVYIRKDKTEPAKRSITIKQLLTHTSGISYDIFASQPVADIIKAAGLTMENVYKEKMSLETYSRAYAPDDLSGHYRIIRVSAVT